MQMTGETKNLRLLAHHDLNGFGNGGEGIALQTVAGGRRVLYIAHESGPKDFTGIDVTDPHTPRVVVQTELPGEELRSNSLALVGDLLLVAYQSLEPGTPLVGVRTYDVSNPSKPKLVSFFDTSGTHSRGAHCLWFVDGRYAHVSTGAADFVPTDPKDDQFYMIVDMSSPSDPREVGRWWLPGTRQGDTEAPPERHPQFDAGFRLHNANVYPQRSDRAYLGYLDAGAIILDISDLSHPRMISRLDYHPPFPGFTHTVMPLFDRGLLVVTDEATTEDCSDWPKLTWVIDVREETNPVIIGTFPMPPKHEFCQRQGRFGSHNIHENQPVPTSWVSDTVIVGAYFNAGVRVHDIRDPFRAEEVGYFIPPNPNGARGVSINDVYVDENALIYAIDRAKGGLYILEMKL